MLTFSYATLYPENAARDWFSSPCDYGPILRAIGPIALQVDDDDYQGDSRVLYHDGDRWGILIFGWGSCSGCDALQGCDSAAEVEALAERLAGAVRWGSHDEIAAYLSVHDWRGDYAWQYDGTRRFVREAAAMLGVTLPVEVAEDSGAEEDK